MDVKYGNRLEYAAYINKSQTQRQVSLMPRQNDLINLSDESPWFKDHWICEGSRLKIRQPSLHSPCISEIHYLIRCTYYVTMSLSHEADVWAVMLKNKNDTVAQFRYERLTAVLSFSQVKQ